MLTDNSTEKQIFKRIVLQGKMPKYLFLDELIYKHNQTLELKLCWEDTANTLHYISLFFEELFCFRLTDESDFLNEPTEPVEKSSSWSLYVVENSFYTKWFHQVSCGLNIERSITHYFIYTQDDIIEVLTEKEPKIKIY